MERRSHAFPLEMTNVSIAHFLCDIFVFSSPHEMSVTNVRYGCCVVEAVHMYTVSQKKCHFIFDYDSGVVSWKIFMAHGV